MVRDAPVIERLSKFHLLNLGRESQPHELLGPQRSNLLGSPKTIVVRGYFPNADCVWILDCDEEVSQEMVRVDELGVFEAECDSETFGTATGKYKYRYLQDGVVMTEYDPYAFPPLLSDEDLYLFNEGNQFQIYEKLGSHLREVDGVTGVNFAVWAPDAQAMSIVGDFNGWDGCRHQMRKRIPSGVWELFIPNLGCGEKYKYRVVDCNGLELEKSDPFAFASELPPRTASVVASLEEYQWNDGAWIAKRESIETQDRAISVYEFHLGSWRTDPAKPNGWMNYRDIAHEIVDYCKRLNFTHIELMPISEHPYTGSWGYQTVGYFACTSRYGTPEDFMYFVDYCHQNDLGVIIDWVPAHFPKDAHGLARFDGTALYEHADPRQGEHPDWNTLIFNYDRNEVRNFLVANALFWLRKYHIDGLRVDAVASMLYLDYSRKEGEWIPNKYGGRENLGAIEFIKKMNDQVHQAFPGVLTIAEESTSWGGVSRPTYAGGLGFSLKWNMGWMNDSLHYFHKDPVYRKYHHDELTFSLMYAFTENFMLPFSHDEVVHGKGALIDQMPGDHWQKFANLRLLYSYMWTHPGKKLIFMGNEIGQWSEWNCDGTLDWSLCEHDMHAGLQKMVGDLNRMYKEESALHEQDFDSNGFEWIDGLNREASVVGYLRRAKTSEDLIVVCNNFTPAVHRNYRLGVPERGRYLEIFNSDSSYYGGSNVGNGMGLYAEGIEAQGRPYSVSLSVPPLGSVVLKKVSE